METFKINITTLQDITETIKVAYKHVILFQGLYTDNICYNKNTS